MPEFLSLLRRNRNCRYTWMGQVVSEIGAHFNNIAVAALVVQTTGSGLAVGGMFLARAIPAFVAGPFAGVLLDRADRRHVMIAADLIRALLAAAFILTVFYPRVWLVYLLSALLMLVAPFFTSGRAAILPAIASGKDLHTANSLTQTTQWATQALGTILAGYAVAWFGYTWAFVYNALAFVASAGAIAALRAEPGAFRAAAADARAVVRPWTDFREGLQYFRRTPLVLGIGLISVGWALGGGAAQILFVLFGDQVFHRGPAGIGMITGFAGLGLLAGGVLGHVIGGRVNFEGYKRTISVSYVSHGATFVLFAVATDYALALVLMAVSRIGMAITSVLNFTQLLRHTPDGYRGRVFSTLESLRWSTMVLSMAAAGFATEFLSPRAVGVIAGCFGALTGILWAAADWRGKLPEPGEEE